MLVNSFAIGVTQSSVANVFSYIYQIKVCEKQKVDWFK